MEKTINSWNLGVGQICKLFWYEVMNETIIIQLYTKEDNKDGIFQ